MKKYFFYVGEIIGAVLKGEFDLPECFCVFCSRPTRFLVSGRESRSIRCFSCKATAISLATITQVQKLKLSPSESVVYELSYHGAVYRYLAENFTNFECSEYFSAYPKGERVNGVRNEDVQSLTFGDESFDLVTSTEVFEHVPNYLAGFSEVCRVLRGGGWFVFTVPLYDSVLTKQICKLMPDGRLEWLESEEYHDSRVTGTRSVPVFWHHSKRQVVSDLLKCGFRYAKVQASNDYVNSIPQFVVVARK
jgi:SAM-dependent methyltransferase